MEESATAAQYAQACSKDGALPMSETELITPRERVLRAVRRQPADRLPTQITFTPLAAAQAAHWLGVEPAALPGVLGNHIEGVGINDIVRVEGDTSFDIWGIGWDNTINDGFQVNVNPLADLGDLQSYTFPDPDDPALYRGLQARIASNEQGRAMVGSMGFCLWEKYYLLRGFQSAMEDLVREPALVEDLLEHILAVQLAVARNLASLRIDAGHTGDDFGSQRGLLFSPVLWRKLLKPRYERLWSVFKSAGLPVIHHSCGDIRDILDDLIDIGLDVLNPVQTHAMPPEELASRWGDRLSFYGGICTQRVLPHATPDEVRAFIECLRATLGRRGGWIMGPSHDATSDMPRENFFAMLEAMGVR